MQKVVSGAVKKKKKTKNWTKVLRDCENVKTSKVKYVQ